MSACSNSKSIANYPLSGGNATTDLFLIQKGTEYKRLPLSALIATQSEVDAGTEDKKFLTPKTLSDFPREDIGIRDFGFLRVLANPATGETFTIQVGSVTEIFEFTAGGGLTTGTVEVVKGATAADTASAWITAINNSDLSMDAIINPGVTNLINWMTGAANEAVTLTDGTGGDVASNKNGDQRAAARTVVVSRKHRITAAEITAGFLMLRFPVSSFPEEVQFTIYDGTSALVGSEAKGGAVNNATYTISGGNINIDFNGDALTDFIIQVTGVGIV